MTLIFAAAYQEVFTEPIKNTERKAFGGPFHAIATHFAPMYRLVSLRSVIAEAAERTFNTLK